MMMSVEIREELSTRRRAGKFRQKPRLLCSSPDTTVHAEYNILGNLQSNYMRCVEQISDCR